jgi:glycosyltransferase involved in cell wall biosynthesis
MDISVVLPFHEKPSANSKKKCRLAHVLQNLAQTQPPPAEVICVDDNSPTSCEPMVRRFGASYVCNPFLAMRPHVGRRALARQVGLQMARGETVLFLDADILVPTEIMSRIATSFLRNADHNVLCFQRRELGRAKTSKSPNEAHVATSYMRNLEGHFRQPIWARQTSHCFAVRRNFILAAGGWDTNFVGWGEEDTELFYRLWRLGGKFVTCRSLVVAHLSHPVNHSENHRSLTRNARYFMRKHPEVARLRREFYRHFGILTGR